VSQDVVILEGKNLNSLIDEGLKKLNRDRDQVEVQILEKGKTLMGVTVKDYKIQISTLHLNNDDILKNTDELLNLKNKEPYISEFFSIKFTDDGVYLSIIDKDAFNANTRQVIEFIRKKRIENVDSKVIEEAINSKENKKYRIAPVQEEILLDAEINIDIPKDASCAFISLVPPSGGKELSVESAFEKIHEQIKYGLNINVVKRMIIEKQYNTKILVAEGEKPIDGDDGYIKYLFPTKTNTKPRVLEDGSVDFRNLDIIHNVRAGDILAELFYPTEGKQGITVKGRVLDSKNGKKVEFRYGKNVTISENGKNLIAEKDGQVSIQDGKVIVKDIFEVKGNVDNSTGNISFNGTVKIKGNVLTGFEINADGDVEIEGVVEGAKISSQGNIHLKRGIQGYNKGRLISKGSIVARYVENSYLEANSDVITDAIMHSEVFSNGSIIVSGKKGLIVGGTCKAYSEIIAKTIGSTMATSTVLEVGVDPNLRTNLDNVKSKIKESETNIEKIDKTITLLRRLSKSGGLTEEKEDTLNKIIQTRSVFVQNLSNYQKELSYIEKQIEFLTKGKIKVESTIYPGVKIIIGNNTMFIRDEIKHCTIYRENNEIKIGPFEL